MDEQERILSLRQMADGVGEAVVPKNLREQLARGTVAAHDAFED